VAIGWMSPPEVAVKWGIPLRTVQTACQSGRLDSQKLGRFYLIAPEDAETFARLHKSRRNGHNTGS
jgi:hypothetical protein